MRKWLPLLGLMLLGTASHAQFVTLFQENFDTIPPGPKTTTDTKDNISGAVTSGGWAIASNLSVSPSNSMKAQRTANKTKYLTTTPFSTAGLTNVVMEFDHIAKVNLVHQARVEYSTDSGATWQVVPSATYLGSSPGYTSTNYFNGASYADPNNSPYWDPFTNSNPTNNWWAHEIFDFTSIFIPSGTTVYNGCMIRWVLADVNPNVSANYAGWYIDNIEIIGATCELQPPTINWNFANARRPIGARYNNLQHVRVEVSDAGSGVDSVWMTYSINGAPDTTVLLTAALSTPCPTTSEYYYHWDSLFVGDTVTWSLYIEDCACPNTTIYPNAASPVPYETFWLDVPPPLKCGPTTVNSFPYIISNLPFTESFENPALWAPGSGTGASGSAHRGTWPLANPPSGRNWTVSPNPTSAGYAWSVRNGSTATANTGPDNDATTGSGNYLYTEASQPFSGNVQTSPFKTPCVDLPLNTCAVLEFKYHMYGSDIDVGQRSLIRVDVDTSTGLNTDQFVNGVYFLIGQQNIGSNSPWQTAIIPLEQFAGQTVNFRFLAVRRSAGDKQDMAVDDIRIYEPDPIDMEMISFVNPINGLCSYSNAEDIEIIMRSKGCLTQDSIPVGFSVSLNGGTPVISTDVVTDTLALGDELQRIYTPKADLSGYGLFEIYAWVNMPGDADGTNDTIGPLYIEHIQPINTFPYVITFDEPSWIYGGGNINNPGTYGTTDWEVLPPPNTAPLAWVIGNQVTEDFNTGPRNDFSGFGNYFYTDSRAVGQNVSRWEMTRCLDLSGLTSPNLSFWYHMYGSNTDLLKVQVQLDGSTAWSDIPNSALSGTAVKQSHETDAWRYKQIDLSGFATDLVRLRFFARSTGTSNQNDIAIDNLMIWDEAGQTDVGIGYVNAPAIAVNLDAINKPAASVYVQNYSGTAKSNIPVILTVTDACNSAQTNTVNYTVPGPIPAHSGLLVTIPTVPTYYPGEFFITASTNMAGDANSYNDTIISMAAGYGSKSIANTSWNFDSCGYDTDGWFTQGGLNAWEHGTPQKGAWNAAYSAPNSWNVANSFDYQNQDEYLRIPPLTDFDTIAGALLRFRHRYSFGADDGGRVEYFQNSNWNQFGFSSTQVGSNWYGNAGVAAFGGEEAWAGNSQWVLSEFPLLIWDYNANPLRLRMAMQTNSTSSGGVGWSIDDFTVVVPPQNSVSPIYGDTKSYLAVPNQKTLLYAKVRNTGEKVLDSCQIRFRVVDANGNGNWKPWEHVAPPSGPWYKGRTITYTFKDSTDVLPSGVYTVEIETQRPVSTFDHLPKDDNRPADDLYSFQLTVLDLVTPTQDSTTYCNDFEDPSVTPLVALNSFDKQGAHDWEFGTPNHPLLTGAHSGSNAWATRLDSNYHNLSESALHAPFFELSPDSTYKISFWHQMNGETYHDGGTVEFSFNGGITWYALGGVNPNGTWYNTTHVTSLDRLKGGWTGTFPWTYSHVTFSVDQPGTAVFRFRFASDYTIDGAGWVVDDICFNTTSESPMTGPISVEENETSPISMLEVYPNPASTYTDLHIVATENGTANIQVTNLLGQVLVNTQEEFTYGQNSVRFNTETWSNGIYLIQTELNGETVIRKFVVTH